MPRVGAGPRVEGAGLTFDAEEGGAGDGPADAVGADAARVVGDVAHRVEPAPGPGVADAQRQRRRQRPVAVEAGVLDGDGVRLDVARRRRRRRRSRHHDAVAQPLDVAKRLALDAARQFHLGRVQRRPRRRRQSLDQFRRS